MKRIPIKLAKLDNYDLLLLPGVIRIRVDGTNDPSIVDIMSEIDSSRGDISIDGQLYSYLDKYELFKDGPHTYLELQAVTASQFR